VLNLEEDKRRASAPSSGEYEKIRENDVVKADRQDRLGPRGSGQWSAAWSTRWGQPIDGKGGPIASKETPQGSEVKAPAIVSRKSVHQPLQNRPSRPVGRQ